MKKVSAVSSPSLRVLPAAALLALCTALGCPSRDAGPGPAKDPAGQSPLAAAHRPPPGPASEWRFPAAPPAVQAPQGPPLSLTASDGTGLRVVALSARSVIEDPLAFTELHLTFQNPQARQIEGQFQITLPPGAAVSRFAMRQGDSWQEGEVVELQAAREAYEDFLHRRQDPALLEKQAGNVFAARVFPIPPSGLKELVLSYSQELAHEGEPYRLLLRGLPQLDTLEIRALLGRRESGPAASSLGGTLQSYQTIEVKKSGFTPNADFEVPLAQGEKHLGLRHENLVVARVTPVTEPQEDPLRSLLVLFDTSASRALGFEAQLEKLRGLLGALGQRPGGGPKVRVLAFDQEVEEVFAGPAGEFGQKALDRLRERQALGASDLQKALLRAAQAQGGPFERVLLVSDGVVTAGPQEASDLRPAIEALGRAGVQRLDVLVEGGIRDEALLQKLATAGLSRGGVILDGALADGEILRRLEQGTLSGIKVSVPGSAWTWPQELNGIQPGDQVLVYADLPRDRPFEVVLEGAKQAARRTAVALQPVERPLLERAWIGARIRRLLHQRETLAAGDQDLREGLRRQVIELSTKFRVLSDFTALLVLETEADYARFHIDRRALSDILTVGPGGVELYNRRSAPPPEPPLAQVDTTPAQKQPETWSLLRKGKDKNKEQAPALANNPLSADGEGGVQEAMKRDRGPATGEGSLAPRGGPPVQPAPPAAVAATEPPSPPAANLPAAAPPPSPLAAQAERRSAEQARMQAASAAAERRSALVMRAPAAKRARASAPRDDAALLGDPLGGDPLGGDGWAGASRAQPRMPETPAYEGKTLEVMTLLKAKKAAEAQRVAQAWQRGEPGDVLALVALGEALEALGQRAQAARAYGSLIDLFPGRADLRRFAGERLERLGEAGLGLAIDSYGKSRAQRPDHPSSHRLHAFALLRSGQPAAAFDVIAEGAGRSYPEGRFRGVDRILREDAGLIAAAWIRAEPGARERVLGRLQALGAQLPERPSLRFVLNWETDANDVDFHIQDARSGHAYYGSPQLPSGGELYADVTTGYGPECFTIEGKPGAYPYKLQAHYYSRGPMGYGMGKLEIIEHDGKGGLRFQERPFLIMTDHAFVDLGTVPGPLPARP